MREEAANKTVEVYDGCWNDVQQGRIMLTMRCMHETHLDIITS